jgi:16S rRNA G966 N2-methylase RsmD
MEYRNPKDLTPHPVSLKLYGDNHIEELLEDIRNNGIVQSLTITDKNVIISGHRRWRCACKLLLETIPVEIKKYDSELAEKKAILSFNKAREKTLSQKMNEAELYEEIVVEEANINIKASQNAPRNERGQFQPVPLKTSALVNTAETVGRDLEIGGEDKYRKAKYIYREAKQGNAKASELIHKLDTEPEKTSVYGAFKELKDYESEQELKTKRAEIAEVGKIIPQSEKWHVEVADINTYQSKRQFDFIITDPPYPKEFLPLYGVLAKRANEWLKPNGLLIAMCGQSYLDQIYSMMSFHLKYYWTAAYLTPGQPTPLRQRQVNSTWKPILIYSPSDNYKDKIFGDVYTSDKPEKDNHEWGQSVSGMLSIIKQICLPGQTIFDPFLGSGTTGVAALQHGCLFYGIDTDEQSVNISKKRLAEVK